MRKSQRLGGWCSEFVFQVAARDTVVEAARQRRHNKSCTDQDRWQKDVREVGKRILVVVKTHPARFLPLQLKERGAQTHRSFTLQPLLYPKTGYPIESQLGLLFELQLFPSPVCPGVLPVSPCTGGQSQRWEQQQ
jgi:hypothetical protein